MLSYNELKERHDTIKDLCTKYRKEITEFQAWVCEIKDLCSSEDYKRLVDEWTLDEFIGNLMNGLFDYDAIHHYKKVLDGEQSIDDFIIESKNMIKDFLL